MDLLRNLTPAQRTALLVAIPVVALVALIGMRRPAPAPEETPDEAPPPIGTIPGYGQTDAIGTGTLASYASAWTDVLANLTGRLTDLEQRPSPTSPNTPAGPRGLLTTRTLAGETTNQLAVRIRRTGAKTPDGRDITTDYLISVNRWPANLNRNAPHWTGTPVRY